MLLIGQNHTIPALFFLTMFNSEAAELLQKLSLDSLDKPLQDPEPAKKVLLFILLFYSWLWPLWGIRGFAASGF